MSDDAQAPDPSAAPPTPFMMLCGSLGAQVHMALGLIPDPTTQKGSVEFDAARQGITMLEDLEKKTRGNLEEEEAKLLSDLLAQLKMLYVQVHKIHEGGADPATDDAPVDPDESKEEGAAS